MIRPFVKLGQLARANLTLRAHFRDRAKKVDPVALMFLKGLVQDEQLIRAMDELVVEYQKAAQSQSVRIGPTAKRAAVDAMSERQFSTPQDRRLAEQGKEREYLQQAEKEVLAAVEKKFGTRCSQLAAKCIEWRQALRRELEKRKFERDSSSRFDGMTSVEAAELEYKLREVKQWKPERVLDQLARAATLFEASDPQLRLWIRLAFLFVDDFEKTPLVERAAKGGRSGSASADAAAIRQLKVLLTQLDAAGVGNDELESDLQMLELVDFKFRLMAGVHVPQLSSVEFRSIYLTAKRGAHEPYALWDRWLTRYCNPENLAHLSKALDGVALFGVDSAAPASSPKPTQPKVPTSTPAAAPQVATAGRENRIAQQKAQQGERVQQLDPTRARKPFVRKVVS